MTNRSWSVYLLLAGLVGAPAALAAQEVSVTIGDIFPNEDHEGCPAYLSSGPGDEPYAGALEEESAVTETRETSTGFGFGAGYQGVNAGANRGTRTVTTEEYSVGYYASTDGEIKRIDCRTLAEIKT